MAELEQLQALTLQVQQLTGAMVDMDKRLQLAEMRGTLTALNTRGSRLGQGRSEFRFSTRCNPSGIGRRGKHSSSNGEPTSSLRTGSIASFWKNRRHHQDVRNGDLDLENQELSVQLYFALVLVMPRESVGVRNVNQGEGAVAWRQILGEYASTEPGNVLAMWSKCGDLRFP